MDLDKIKNKKVIVKSKFSNLTGYEKWTEVTSFLACGLVGVDRKYKIQLKEIKK